MTRRARGVFSLEFRYLSWADRLIALSILFVPFQSALTVDVGFPLKVSEILLAVGFIWKLIARKSYKSRFSSDLLFMSGLALWVVVSTVRALFVIDPARDVQGVHRGLYVDLIAYCSYGLVIIIFWLLARQLSPILIRDLLIQALWLCFVSVVLQIVFFLIDRPKILEVLSFDMRRRGQEWFGVQLARNGPFLEGQHLGFFAGAVLVVALFSRRYVSAAIAAFCVVYAQSTTGILATAAAIVLALLLRPTKLGYITFGAVVAIGGVLALTVPSIQTAIRFQIAKLGFLVNPAVSNAEQSLSIRTIKTEVGWRIMWDHPLFGVGPGRYAAVFHQYSGDYNLPSYYYKSDVRPIAENGYMHLGSEFGLLAFCLFIVLILWLAIRVFKVSRAALALTIFVVVGFTTQSSWTFLPIWAMIALVTSVAVHQTPIETAPQRGKFSLWDKGANGYTTLRGTTEKSKEDRAAGGE